MQLKIITTITKTIILINILLMQIMTLQITTQLKIIMIIQTIIMDHLINTPTIKLKTTKSIIKTFQEAFNKIYK